MSATLVAGFFAFVIAVTGYCSSQQAGPQPNPTTAYSIEVSIEGGPFETTRIGPDGEGCEMFHRHENTERTCFIAKLVNPWTIGGEAYGELNDRRTPALDAMVWRARLAADVSVCSRGGLLGPYLSECEALAVDPNYLYESGPFQVRVPIGGAEPVPAGT